MPSFAFLFALLRIGSVEWYGERYWLVFRVCVVRLLMRTDMETKNNDSMARAHCGRAVRVAVVVINIDHVQ